MNLRELKRSLQEKTFTCNNNEQLKFEILATILTENNNIIKGRLQNINVSKENKSITLHFFECFPRT
ncbi:MAG TPA: hypothetical protein VF849_00075 [Blattabacteriaceae bacterium]